MTENDTSDVGGYLRSLAPQDVDVVVQTYPEWYIFHFLVGPVRAAMAMVLPCPPATGLADVLGDFSEIALASDYVTDDQWMLLFDRDDADPDKPVDQRRPGWILRSHFSYDPVAAQEEMTE